MSVEGWGYYNHAMIPTCAPHEEPDLTPLQNGDIWKFSHGGKKPLLVRWTTDFDCGKETHWWYIIKDTPFDISALKAKRRYEINKGYRNFIVRRLSKPEEYAEELYEVQIAAFSAYPLKYRPTVDKQHFISAVTGWAKNGIVYAAFSVTDGQLCGYSYLSQKGKVLNFNVQKTRPDSEKLAVNAVLIFKILEDFQMELRNGCYICDGARSILHETAFQDYLEKYFGFRKAYCRLHIEYNPKVKWLVLSLYHFRNVFKKLDNIGIFHSMNGVFAMQKIVREQEKRNE